MAAGAIAGYAVQVGENRDQGMDWSSALTTNISGEKILSGALIAGGVIIGAAAVSIGLAAVGITAGAACADGDCTNEVNAVSKGINSSLGENGGLPNKIKAIAPYYPANNGFSGRPEMTTLQPGLLVDRFGSKYGQYLTDKGTPA